MKLNRKIKHKKLNHFIRVFCLTGALVAYSSSMYAAVIDNIALPEGGKWMNGSSGTINKPGNNVMDIVQKEQNAVIKWDKFNIGANAEVNFSKDGGGSFNILNYVDSGNTSQIYGAMNAKDGNVFLVNTAGTVIGKSAQINVGSLYVSNKKLDDTKFNQFNGKNINSMLHNEQPPSAAQIMSLGNINANKITFEGNRIVLDTERLSTDDKKMVAENILLKTDDKDNIVAGYDAYDKTYAGKNTDEVLAKVQVGEGAAENLTKKDGYMWVKNLEQLQAMKSNLEGNYALHNSIDAIATESKGFTSIGSADSAFKGKFDGLENEIFGLTIKGDENVGFFGYTDGASINNVTLVSGNIIGNKNVGSVVGNANDTSISNVKNSVHVTGNTNVGGVVGNAQDTDIKNVINTAPIRGHENVGGIAGSMTGGSITGETYNIGAVTGIGSVNAETDAVTPDGEYVEKEDLTTDELAEKYSHNIGGIVGSAKDTAIGNDKGFQIYNQLNITGGYNVGGIVGNMQGGKVQNVANNGDILALGHTLGDYNFRTNHSNYGGTATHTEIINEELYTANAGGIIGITNEDQKADSKTTISNVLNTGDVKSLEVDYTDKNQNPDKHYIAGNIGGIVGSANNTDITNAENRENVVHGAHNIGGVAGSYTGKGIISNAMNNGGDIMGTGARNKDGYVTEVLVGPDTGSDTTYIIGNVGGIVGSMYGNDVKINGSANRGTVHTRYVGEIKKESDVVESSKAGNVGGIVGKIDREVVTGDDKAALLGQFKKGDYSHASVSNSYNTGLVQGYVGVGGVAGAMYNGSVANSYNIGDIKSSRQVLPSDRYGGVNLGGIVGDSLEKTNSEILLYGVYNNGTIGDKEFKLYGRQAAGIVGRLSGDVYNSYNTGDIYNGYNVAGGIVGWWFKGDMHNVFNTGNITVVNKGHEETPIDYSSVGGIAGGTSSPVIGYDNEGKKVYGTIALTNAYNLGTIRVVDGDDSDVDNIGYVGGIIGKVSWNSNIKINNVYSASEILVLEYDPNGKVNIEGLGKFSYDNDFVGGIYGGAGSKGKVIELKNAYVIDSGSEYGFFNKLNDKRTDDNPDDAIEKVTFLTLEEASKKENWGNGFIFDSDLNGKNDASSSAVAFEDSWRFYGGLPIMNAFLPKLALDGGLHDANGDKINIQYGNAYNPFLNIIDSTDAITINGSQLNRVDGVTVFNGGDLNVQGLGDGSGMMYGGTLYTDGALNVSGVEGADLKLGKASELYGSSVKITSSGDFAANGTIIGTGETDGKTGVSIAADGDVEILGEVKTLKKGDKLTVDGLQKVAQIKKFYEAEVLDPRKELPTLGNVYGETTEGAKADGDISISSDNGNVDILYGNLGDGFVNSSGSLNVSGKEVYIDSDLLIGGDLNITGDTSVLDISNIGKIQTPADNVSGLHAFIDHFKNGNSINFNGKTVTKADAMITVDLWDEESKRFELDKFDYHKADGDKEHHSLFADLNDLNVNVDNAKANGNDLTHIWVSTAEQLQGIQGYYKLHGNNILDRNFALKNDIDASSLDHFEAIGAGSEFGFTGEFDGRGNAIIGLNIDDTKVEDHTDTGLFSKVGTGGVVDDLHVLASSVAGNKHVGLIAGENNGTISNIFGFGNSVSVKDDNPDSVGAVGGIAGLNDVKGTITDVDVYGTVKSSDKAATYMGGIVGTNGGTIQNSSSSSAVSVTGGIAGSMGGIAGTNAGGAEVNNVESHGVLSGLYKDDKDGSKYHSANNVGGIVGINSGKVTSGYNESIVSGFNNVGGVVGHNEAGATMNNLANAMEIYGGSNVGGIAGFNEGEITNGRNNGEILGAKGMALVDDVDGDGKADRNSDVSTGENVGGLVGHAGANAFMSNLVNDMSASITGYGNVGGIIGQNDGVLTSSNNLMNKGTISGVRNVGGVVGVNSGIIANINNQNSFNIEINKAYQVDSQDYVNFGGVVGDNESDGIVFNVANSGNINATEANNVGGIMGVNNGLALGILANSGNVTGKNTVGGIMGVNNRDIDYKNVSDETLNDLNEKLNLAGDKLLKKDDLKAYMVNGAKVEGNLEDIHDLQHDFRLHANTVTGNESVGGVIGANKGAIEHSDVINTTLATVEGQKFVGGLIGHNTGSITGGRDDKDQYYAHHVYNNGTVNGGAGDNAGGLVGWNGGGITAAYNTGAVSGKGDNIGGIAGYNSGAIKEVFNTIMVEDTTAESGYKLGTVSGNSDVGGLVGQNNGMLTNSYNTSEVKGSSAVGNAVGANLEHGRVNGVYATNTNGALVGYNKNLVEGSYSLSQGDTGKQGITVLSAEASKDSDSYKDGLGGGDNAVWKFYDGFNTPLLQVFLTKAEYVGDREFTYNGKEQGLGLGNLSASDALKAHYYSIGGLLHAIKNKNAGEYLAFWSEQIGAGKYETDEQFNPNNLGYDIDVNYKINKATLDVILNEISRIYGNTALNKGEYGYDYKITNGELTEEMISELQNLGVIEVVDDDALKDKAHTNDVGDYTWSGKLSLNDELAKNYEFTNKQSAAEFKGKSSVSKANLNITVGDQNIQAGASPDYTGKIEGLVNGDKFDGGFGIVDKTYEGQEGTHKDVIGIVINGKVYTLTGEDWTQNGFWKNYDITLDAGDLTVTAPELPPVDPDEPGVEGWQFWEAEDKYPWGKKREERERKAEIHFVDGGMKI